MKRIIQLIFLLIQLVFSIRSECQSNYHTFSGFIVDSTSGERLSYVNVVDLEWGSGTVSNDYGFFSLQLPEGKRNIQFTYVGYAAAVIGINSSTDIQRNIPLVQNAHIQEVVLVGNREHESNNFQKIQINDIKEIPIAMGEADVLRVAQYLPGISSGMEGSTGLSVRGGDFDQNLYVLDGVPIYNVSHLFGFFSVFNPDALKDFTIYKNSFPARFGGRLSSVVDVRMKEGNNQKTEGNISIGLLASKASIEGPIIKNKMSYILSARRTYLDLLLKPFNNSLEEFDGTSYYFYDFNGKINYIFSDKSRIYFSFYNGADKSEKLIEKAFQHENYFSKSIKDEDIGWGNLMNSFRWNYLISNKLFSNLTLAYSKYDYSSSLKRESLTYYNDGNGIYGSENNIRKVNSSNQLDYYFAKYETNFFPVSWYNLNTGVEFNFTKLQPTTQDESVTLGPLPLESSYFSPMDYSIRQTDVFIENIIKPFDRLELNIGARYNYYNNGKQYQNIDPRISINYRFKKIMNLSIDYSEMTQHIRTLSYSNIQMANELIVTSTNQVPPAHSKQTSFGVNGLISDTWSYSSNIFYKYMYNLIEYIEGASYKNQNVNWETLSTTGKGQSYGFEVYIEKNAGNTKGWISYTLSKSDRVFEHIHYGRPFPYKFDRRHILNLVLNREINSKWSAGMVWTFSSGFWLTGAQGIYANPFTFTYEKTYEMSILERIRNITDYSRNNYQVPPYHRLDLNINYNMKHNKGSESVISFGLYNAYNRKNVYSASFIISSTYFGNNGALFGNINKTYLIPILPYITYNYKF